MKISELISKLQELQAAHGDVAVYSYDNEEGDHFELSDESVRFEEWTHREFRVVPNVWPVQMAEAEAVEASGVVIR